jgi:hypothetical protein
MAITVRKYAVTHAKIIYVPQKMGIAIKVVFLIGMVNHVMNDVTLIV